VGKLLCAGAARVAKTEGRIEIPSTNSRNRFKLNRRMGDHIDEFINQWVLHDNKLVSFNTGIDQMESLTSNNLIT